MYDLGDHPEMRKVCILLLLTKCLLNMNNSNSNLYGVTKGSTETFNQVLVLPFDAIFSLLSFQTPGRSNKASVSATLDRKTEASMYSYFFMEIQKVLRNGRNKIINVIKIINK